MKSSPSFNSISEVIQARKTQKVLCEIDDYVPVESEVEARHRPKVLSAVTTAGWAPFHHARSTEVVEPWRVHILWNKECIAAARHMRDVLGAKNKEVQLAAACSALLLVTWLPQFYTDKQRYESQLSIAKQREIDEEHLAATAAFIQNLLLLLTEEGFGTYWSTGFHFRQDPMFEYLGIDRAERLLAGVFIEYPEMQRLDRFRLDGKHRNKRGDKWIRVVKIP